ncbi:Intersectin 1 (SH3 domain protein) [Sparganum proliferum]
MNLKSAFEKYWSTLGQLRSLTKSIDETILTILKPSLDHGVLTSIADEKPPLSRLKDLKKPHLSSSLGEVEDVLKIITKAEVAQLSENRAGNAGDKAQEAKKEAEKINGELRFKIPETEKFVRSSITEFANEYLNFVDEEIEVEKKCRSVMRNWLFANSSKPTAETKAAASMRTPILIARSQPSADYDVSSKPSQNGTANSEKKTHVAKAAAEKPIPTTSCIAKLAEDSEDSEEENDGDGSEEKGKEEEEDEEDVSELSYSASDNSDSEDTGSEEVSEKNEDNEHSTKGHEADDLCSLPAPFKVVALYPYKAQEDDELDMSQKDIIEVVDRDDVEKEPGWLYGKNKRTGKSGLFPTNHVKKAD